MQTLYSRSVRQQDAIHTLKKCFVIKNPNLCQRVGWNFTRREHVFSHLGQSFSWISGRIHNTVFP